MIYDSFKYLFDDKEWSAFNKKSFKYADCSTCSDRLNLDLYDNTDGFVTQYSKSIASEVASRGITEDFENRIQQFLITDKTNIENKTKKDPILLNKVNYIKSGIDKINNL